MLSDLEKEAICLKLGHLLNGLEDPPFKFDHRSIYQKDTHWFLFGLNGELIPTDAWAGMGKYYEMLCSWLYEEVGCDTSMTPLEPGRVIYSDGAGEFHVDSVGSCDVFVTMPGGMLGIVGDGEFTYVDDGKLYTIEFQEMLHG